MSSQKNSLPLATLSFPSWRAGFQSALVGLEARHQVMDTMDDMDKVDVGYFQMNKLRPVLIIVFIVCLALPGCNVSPRSIGVEGSLVIAADPADRPILEPHLNRSFGRIIETPQPEPLFSINWVDASTLAQQTRSPLILMTAALDGSGPTAEMLRTMLTPEVMEGVREGSYMVFKRRDPWAKGQLLLILVGRDSRELADNAAAWSDSLCRWAVDFERQRIMGELFRRAEQKKLEQYITSRYGFRIRIQHDYLLAEENDSLSFVRLLRHYPDRWLTVAWGTLPADSSFSPRFIFERRRTIGGGFLDPVELYDDRWTFEEASRAGEPGCLIRGLWATVDPTGGGPFFTYGLFDAVTRRYYLIDGAVFAPGTDKMPLLWQLDAIAHTFKADKEDP